jgi:hypothetical protein
MSPTLRSIVVLGFWLACPVAIAGQTVAPLQSPVTLQPLLDAALANNRTLKIAEAQIAKADADLSAARTRQWPEFDLQLFEGQTSSFDFTFRTGVFGTFPATGPIPPEDTKVNNPSRLATVFQFQASQPLTQLFRIRANIRQLQYERDVMEQRRRARAQALASDVRRHYYAVLEAQSAVRAADAGINYHKELYRVAREQQDARTAFEADTLAVQAELARRQYVGTAARNQQATATQQLGILIGRDIDPALTFVPAEGLPRLEIDLASAQARAVKQRPEIREAELKVQRAQQGVEAVFQNTTPALADVAEKMVRERYTPGSYIVRQGEEGEKFYLIRSGTVNVVREADGSSESIATLTRGDFFGEVALLSGGARNATIVAIEPTVVYSLKKGDFLAALAASPSLDDQLRGVFFTRS